MIRAGDKAVLWGEVVEITARRNVKTWWVKTKSGRDWASDRYLTPLIRAVVQPDGIVKQDNKTWEGVFNVSASIGDTVLGYERDGRFVIVKAERGEGE